MNNRIIIRKATLADLESMIDLLTELFSIEVDFTIDRSKQSNGLKILLRSGSASLWVAEVNSEVVGMVSAQMNISTAEGGLSALLEDLIVRQEFRKQGIGTKLLNTAINWAEFKGAKRVQLLSDKRNQPALDFYTKEGWTTTNMIALRKGIQERSAPVREF